MATLLEKLKEEQLLSQEDIISIEAESRSEGKREEEVILDEDMVSEEDLFRVKSELLGMPIKDDVDAKDISQDVIKVIPENSAKYYKMVPLGKKGDTIEVGMVFPDDLKAKEALNFLAYRYKFSYETFLITPSSFARAIKQYQSFQEQVGSVLEEIETEGLEEEETKEEEEDETTKEFRKLAEEAPIIRMVGVIIKQAVEGGASDIHIEPEKDKLKVRFRVAGSLYSSLFLPLKVHQAIVARVKILSNLRIDERRLPQDGRFSAKVQGKNIDFRVATLPTTQGEKVVIRVLDPEKGMMTFEDLGLSGRNLEFVNSALSKSHGLTLVTGPTGSGKTTTLYSVLGVLNNEEVNIVTLEDPVEYFMEGINQSQVQPAINYTFANGLRQILRQDPDIIMVGEIRDEETAELAIHAALTGHIVLATLHTNTATGAVPRLIDMGIKPFLIPPSLNSVIAQRLVKKLCPSCREEMEPAPEIRKIIEEELRESPFELNEEIKIYKAKGCIKCGEEGFTGRIGIFEVFNVDSSIRSSVAEDQSRSKIEELARKAGMITLRQDGIHKALQGLTTIEEVLKVTGAE